MASDAFLDVTKLILLPTSFYQAMLIYSNMKFWKLSNSLNKLHVPICTWNTFILISKHSSQCISTSSCLSTILQRKIHSRAAHLKQTLTPYSVVVSPLRQFSTASLGGDGEHEKNAGQSVASEGSLLESTPAPDAACDLPADATVADALSHHTALLEAQSVPEASLCTQHLLAAVLGTTRADLHSLSDRVLTPSEREELKRYIICRMQRMPVQYIVGGWDFHDITLDLWPPVFIPRPETEQLVERVLHCVRSWPEGKSPRLLELCAGSGAISLALLHACHQLSVTAVDQSGQAVALAAHNAQKLGLLSRLALLHTKVERKPLLQLPLCSYDIIVSNPPYVPSRDIARLEPEIFLYEDLRALEGGPDGLDVIRIILWHAAQLLSDGGRLFLEVDQTHGRLLPAWLEKYKQTAEGSSLRPLFVDQVEKDVFGKDRYITIIKRCFQEE